MNDATYCGYIAIVGRPNVGKSTLLNHILGKKISITSRKPQTTRNRILGIKTTENCQALYVDTPGLHAKNERALNRMMNKEAITAISDVDLIVFVVDARGWTEEDEFVWTRLQSSKVPMILVLNKEDELEKREDLLPFIDRLKDRFSQMEIVPISALKGNNIDYLEKVIKRFLPEGPFLFAADRMTDITDEFLISEMVREKLMRVTGQEVPYAVAVRVEKKEMKGAVLHLNVLIVVDRPGQKAIIIGKQGKKLKEIGRQARLDLEKLFNCKIFLSLWVKVKSGWSDDEAFIQRSF